MIKLFSLALVASAVGLALLAPPALAASCEAPQLRWASSSNRLYVGGVDTVCTLPELAALMPAVPLELVDANDGVWLLGANIVLQGGATLQVHGPDVARPN